MADENDDTLDTDRWESRQMPGPVALASLMLHSLDLMYNALIRLTPEGPEKDLITIEWSRERDYYKPVLERIIRRGR